MHQTRIASANRSAKSSFDKAMDAIAERLGRVLEALGPRQQLQPVPVRIRSDRPAKRY